MNILRAAIRVINPSRCRRSTLSIASVSVSLVGIMAIASLLLGLLCPGPIQAADLSERPFSGTPFNPLPTFQYLGQFEAEVDFLVESGKSDPNQVFAYWKDQGAGYLLAGLEVDGQRGVSLPEGLYRWNFRLRRGSEPVQMPSSPVFRISVWDVTTGDLLAERMLHQSDFDSADVWYDKHLLHSTVGRAGHRFEPRVYWADFVDGHADYVLLDQAVSHPTENLEQKALLLDDLMHTYLDPIPRVDVPALVVGRQYDGLAWQSAHRGDAATWTALYTASQAFRLTARPDDPVARRNMERSFWALHHLHKVTNESGVVARYVDASGNWNYADRCDGSWKAGRVRVDANGLPVCGLPETTCGQKGPICPSRVSYYDQWSKTLISEDIYAGFSAAVSVGYPLITDPKLKEAIASDMKAIARNFLQNDFRIQKTGADGIAPKYVHFNPYPPQDDLRKVIEDRLEKGDFENLRHVHKTVDKFVKSYNSVANTAAFVSFITFNCIKRFPDLPSNLNPIGNDLVMAIENKDVEAIMNLLPGFISRARSSLLSLHASLRKSSGVIKAAIECAGRLPNSSKGENLRDLLRFVDEQILPQLQTLIGKLPAHISTLKELKVDASSALAAAHLLSAARLVAPEEFGGPYYEYLLGGGKDLLQTMEVWDGVDETVATLSGGDLRADQQRSSTNWRSYMALFDLIRLEDRHDIRERYRQLLARAWSASADEGNAFYEVIRSASGVSRPISVDAGIVGWGLSNIPVTRRGWSSTDLWPDMAVDIGTVSGGLTEWNGEAGVGRVRDPSPVAVRALRDIFLWQRNPREVGRDANVEGAYFPSVDYLLPYWMARATGLDPVSPTTSSSLRIRPAQRLKSSGEVGLTIGKSYEFDCKTLGGAVTTPNELGTLPGPYGRFPVGRNGARLAQGYGHIYPVMAKGKWKLDIEVRPNGLYYWVEVCRGALHADGREGAKVKFIATISAPATVKDDRIGAMCPAHTVVASGDMGRTLGSGLKRKTKTLSSTLNMPAGSGPLQGPMGTFSLDGNGYDDGYVRIRVKVYKRVSAFQMTKTPQGVQVYAEIKRPSKFKGGAEIKIAVELLGIQNRSFRIAPLPQVLTFTAEEGQESPAPQFFTVQPEAANCDLGSRSWVAHIEGDLPWAFLSKTGGLLPSGEVRARASALNLPAQSEPYRSRLLVEVPGAQNNPQSADLELYVTPARDPLLTHVEGPPQTIGCSNATNIALGANPHQSDRGWGGGSNVAHIVDGLRSYSSWANGLAFTGGAVGWGGELGGTRQATIDFGVTKKFDRVVLWWHGVSYTPSVVSLFFWNDGDAKWTAIPRVTRKYGEQYEEGANSGYSHSDEYRFAEMTSRMVRVVFDDLATAVDGSQMIHGWLYEAEVYGCEH